MNGHPKSGMRAMSNGLGQGLHLSSPSVSWGVSTHVQAPSVPLSQTLERQNLAISLITKIYQVILM